ncbi:hypothetical protein [Xylophilus sp. GOD-11R]|uniref:hypothetical protein n=1 Tax=Xylophilus sp. GOD-11R TaxID=3089814 RepID=UPI00298D16EA|nr:hypothetical protein [Xylophilus sp. GOD-11R]WPB54953.1 hypothetical protein R9X41_12285 [Xylophilus sp. GOD-11R]
MSGRRSGGHRPGTGFDRWHRRCTYAALVACATTGLVWLVMLDMLDQPAPRLRLWWITHGCSAWLVAMALGAAWPHVRGAWKSGRNRIVGSTALLGLVTLGSSALLLMYGAESVRPSAHVLHVVTGLAAMGVFPWHVVRGRRRQS